MPAGAAIAAATAAVRFGILSMIIATTLKTTIMITIKTTIMIMIRTTIIVDAVRAVLSADAAVAAAAMVGAVPLLHVTE